MQVRNQQYPYWHLLSWYVCFKNTSSSFQTNDTKQFWKVVMHFWIAEILKWESDNAQNTDQYIVTSGQVWIVCICWNPFLPCSLLYFLILSLVMDVLRGGWGGWSWGVAHVRVPGIPALLQTSVLCLVSHDATSCQHPQLIQGTAGNDWHRHSTLLHYTGRSVTPLKSLFVWKHKILQHADWKFGKRIRHMKFEAHDTKSFSKLNW